MKPVITVVIIKSNTKENYPKCHKCQDQQFRIYCNFAEPKWSPTAITFLRCSTVCHNLL